MDAADRLSEFVELRPLLVGVAYRMLGSSAEAEDAVQDAYLRWSGADTTRVSSSRAYLITTVTRLCIDRLRSAQARRVSYPGPWLPEPVITEETDPAADAELADSLSLAFLVLLEELGPVERAAFLLRDVFAYPYGEIASMIGRSEGNSRQLVARARQRIGDRRRRFDADAAAGRDLTRRFMVACASGDMSGLVSMLTEDIVVWADGGGRARAAPRPVVGAGRAARFLINVAKRNAHAKARQAKLNGQPGLLLEENGTVTTALVLEIVDGAIAGVRVVRNPEKLTAVQPRTSTGVLPFPR